MAASASGHGAGRGGWEGRIAALDEDGTRATLEAGGMRVTSTSTTSTPSLGAPRDGDAAPWASRTRAVGRARPPCAWSAPGSVASSLDLRGARVDEALEALDRYLDDASLAGLDAVTIIHGLGTGALRDAVRAAAGAHPLVQRVRAGRARRGRRRGDDRHALSGARLARASAASATRLGPASPPPGPRAPARSRCRLGQRIGAERVARTVGVARHGGASGQTLRRRELALPTCGRTARTQPL